MGGFGRTAIRARELFVSRKVYDPKEAWNVASQKILTSLSTQKKVCPRCAFLGLCEEGMVKGIPEGSYTDSVEDKKYALQGVKALKKDPTLAFNKSALWRVATEGKDIAHNQQMDVVVELWKKELLDI